MNVKFTNKILQLYLRTMSLKKILFLSMLTIISFSIENEATGVFELELLQLDLKSTPTSITTNNHNTIKNNETISKYQNNANSQNFIRVFVCLKEAFTDKLDGPCTFGNASLTLDRDLIGSNAKNGEQNSKQGSQLTNIVRILFTFRWTKSFTIILTAEQLQIDGLNHQQHRQITQVRQRTTTNPLLIHGGNSSFFHINENDNGDDDVDYNGNNGDNNSETINKKFPKESTIENEENMSTSSVSNVNKFENFIDRHILTEIEVLPNLEQNSNKLWTTKHSRTHKSYLEYKFRVYCSLNHYGDGCTTFCRARDDQFGHYNCSSNGQKICFDGWEGVDCDKAKCGSGCNQQHGYCEKPNTCLCRYGWTGPRCDECLTYPGCQNGFCLTSWQCICHKNWGGVYCDQDLNYCGTHDPCKNNGTCQNVSPGKYKCHCPQKFTGVDCGIDLSLLPGAGTLTQISAGCALNPCQNGGTCFAYNNFIDSTTSIIEQNSTNNENYNLTLLDSTLNDSSNSYLENSKSDYELKADSNKYYRCQCAPGWVGDYCQWLDTSLLPITNLIYNNLSTTTTTDPGIHIETLGPITTGSSVTSDSSTSLDSNTTTILENQIIDSITEIKYPANFIENNHKIHVGQHVEMRHLISWVVIATVIGVFLACLLIVWCCLIAIERSKFSFIQMNIIRNGDNPDYYHQQQHSDTTISSRLRRVHEKIRDSFRKSSTNRIKPETKLSIENVLKPPPPPSYEESNYYCPNKIKSIEHLNLSDKVNNNISTINENLVIRGAIVEKLAKATTSDQLMKNDQTNINLNDSHKPNINCPRHGHLYRQKQWNDYYHQIITGPDSTCITIEKTKN